MLPSNLRLAESSICYIFGQSRYPLHLESTLRELRLYDAIVDSECLGRDVAQILENDPLLPGLILMKQGRFVGALSRRRFFERMSRPYSVELFYKRPIHILYEFTPIQNLILSGDLSIVSAAIKSVQRQPEWLYEPLVIRMKEQGSWVYKLLDVHQLLLANSQIHQMTIAALRNSRQSLLKEKEKAQVTLKSIGDAVITTDLAGYVEFLNPVAEKLTGWRMQDARGKLLQEVFRVIHETTREPVRNPVETVLQSGYTVGLTNHTILVSRDGTEVYIDNSAAPIYTSEHQLLGAVLVFHDVTAERKLAKQLTWQATHDMLTGLVNRSEFERQIERILMDCRFEQQEHTVCYIDLDQFKIVNDTCGHFAGDELLRQITALLQHRTRISDCLARLGGDEFGLLLRQCPLNQGILVAKALHESIQKFRFVWENKTFSVSASIGLTVINGHNKNLTTILSEADTACYAAKNRGRDRIQVYHANDRELLQQHGQMEWVSRINQALEENRFRLYYQHIASINPLNTQCQHYEVLLRLIDESGQIVLPKAFLPAAERYNLMPTIDRWVIKTLFARQKDYYQREPRWDENFHQVYAINLSGASLNDEQFIDFLYEQFEAFSIPPQTICFEITETVAIVNLSKATQFIRSLKELGCRFALDDFGSGMSSFAYLKTLPVDYLKIDGSFVKDIVSDHIALAMVESINQIGQMMGLQTIAEFVENRAILEKIRNLGVNYAQGYGIAKPKPLALNLLARDRLSYQNLDLYLEERGDLTDSA